MLNDGQRSSIENFFHQHPQALLWSGDAAEFVATPTPLTQSLIITALNDNTVWQKAAQHIECPIHTERHRDHFFVLLHHTYVDLTSEAKLFFSGNVSWQVSDVYTKPQMKQSVFTSVLHPSYLLWQAKVIQPTFTSSVLNRLEQQAAKLFQSQSSKDDESITSIHVQLKEALSIILAVGLLDGLWEQYVKQTLKNKYARDWEQVEQYHSDQVAKADQYLQSIAQIGAIGIDSKKLSAYLAVFGNRAFDDYELSSQRFHEIPDKVMMMAKTAEVTHSSSAEAIPPNVMSLSDVKLIDTASRVKAVRGTLRLQILQIVNQLRQRIVQTARQHHISEDQIFFYYLHELEQLPQKLDEKVIQERQHTYHQDCNTWLPPLLMAKTIQHSVFEPEAVKTSESMFVLAVSSGVVKGKVVIVTSESQIVDEHQIVLVLPNSSAMYSHLYPKAAAIIFRQGGVMSHGAIVAREYHIPAVSLSGKPYEFTNGEIVMVDGVVGKVSRA